MYSHLSAGCLNVAPLTFNFIGLLVVLSGQGKQKAPLFSVCLCLIATLWSLPAEAHRSYESYLTFRMDDQPALVWEIETNNFETLFNLDDNGNEIISWGEILAHQDELLAYAFEHINLTFDEQALALEVQQVVVNRKDDQTYLIVHLDLPDAFRPQVLGIEYRLFFDVDKQQRLLLNIQSNLEGAVYPLSPQKTQLEVDIKTNNLWFQVDLNLLRANTAYDAPYRANSAPVQLMWQALESFSHVERSLFLRYALRPVSPATTSGCVTPSHCQRTIDIDLFMLCLLVLAVTIVALVGRFVWGRSRLPSNGDFAGESFKVRPLQCSNANMSLPESATCFFRIKLPKYTDLNACKDRLR